MIATANSGEALEKQYIYYNGKTVAELQILTAAEAERANSGDEDEDEGEGEEKKTYMDLPTELSPAIVSSTS